MTRQEYESIGLAIAKGFEDAIKNDHLEKIKKKIIYDIVEKTLNLSDDQKTQIKKQLGIQNRNLCIEECLKIDIFEYIAGLEKIINDYENSLKEKLNISEKTFL